MFKVVHQESGEMAAFLRWTFPTVLTAEEKAEREKEKLFREEEKKAGRVSCSLLYSLVSRSVFLEWWREGVLGYDFKVPWA